MGRSVLMVGLVATLSACGWPEHPDYTLSNGLAVSVHTTEAPWAHEPLFRDQLDRSTSDALVWWGGDAGELTGWELVLSDARPCDGANGCEEGYRDTLTVYVGTTYAHCWPQAAVVLWHEIGHVVIGDNDHADPRWREIPMPSGSCLMPPPVFHES